MRDLLYLLERTAQNVIDSEYIDTTRKAWKAWMKSTTRPSYNFKPGEWSETWEPEKRYERGLALLKQEAGHALEILERGKMFLDRLRNDLLINKGLWSTGESPFKASSLQQTKKKVWQHLDAVRSILGEGESRIESLVGRADPAMGIFFEPEDLSSDRQFQYLLNALMDAVTYSAKAADSEISGKMFRHLSKMVKKFGDLDYIPYEPTELSIGRMKIVFADTPTTERDRRVMKGGREPTWRSGFISDLKEAFARIQQAKLEHLWYGILYVRPKQLAPENSYGVHFGVGATYHRQGDYITLYSDPGRLAPLILHELGHRYYYKFLSAHDRMNFDRWFGKVKATSTYGATVSAEDFAEVFSDYMARKDLTRDQIDRFKIVLGKTHRTEDRLASLLRVLTR